jgi:hypothetical protein
MVDAAAWKALLDGWPAGMARIGVLVTTLNEQIPFEGFMHNASFIMVERKTPDTLGARKLIVPLSGIAMIKFIEVMNSQAFAPWGFAASATAKKSPA